MTAPEERTLISHLERRHRIGRPLLRTFVALVTVALVVTAAGPLAWLFKAATSTSIEIVADPLGLWPSGVHWENFGIIWNQVDFARYFLNTVWVMLGSVVLGLLVATTGGYWLAVLKPRGAPVISALVLATLFIPSVVSLVALYLTVIEVPIIGANLINTFWAVWLPASANAVSVLLMQRFFASIPAEVFEAAKIDGAGPLRIFTSMVLPMSRPIIGVLSLLTLVSAYKEFLWPLLVLPGPEVQPISVVLPRLQEDAPLGPYMAALFISAIVPIVLFLIFQRQFLRAAGSVGALKG